MSEAELNWSTAKVKNAKLKVDLDGELPSGWKDSFNAVARLLGGPADWGEVSLSRKKTVSVADVSEGSEERLRHFLESVVEQANADHRPDDSQRERSDEQDDDEEDEGDESGSDAEMSERFRSFAD